MRGFRFLITLATITAMANTYIPVIAAEELILCPERFEVDGLELPFCSSQPIHAAESAWRIARITMVSVGFYSD